MARLTITTKDQMTVPEEIREHLGVDVGDSLRWEVVPGGATVSIAGSSLRGVVVMASAGASVLNPASDVVTSFLDLRGALRVGPGSSVQDIKRSRKMRGTDRE